MVLTMAGLQVAAFTLCAVHLRKQSLPAFRTDWTFQLRNAKLELGMGWLGTLFGWAVDTLAGCNFLLGLQGKNDWHFL
jgi:hypothetical protein